MTSKLTLKSPLVNKIYCIVLGFDSGTAEGNVTYAQSQ